jgi:hypothetical protein
MSENLKKILAGNGTFTDKASGTLSRKDADFYSRKFKKLFRNK